MSIFGVKRKHVDTSALKQEISNIKSQVFPQINNLYDGHTELQNTYTELQNTYTELQNIYTELQNRVSEINIDHRLLGKKVENIPDRKIISICAEITGGLGEGDVFSFGDGGKKEGAGYVMSFPGQILGIGLSCVRSGGGFVVVLVSINGIHQTSSTTTLFREYNGYKNFDEPLRVEAGDKIEFISKIDTRGCARAVVSMIIELFI